MTSSKEFQQLEVGDRLCIIIENLQNYVIPHQFIDPSSDVYSDLDEALIYLNRAYQKIWRVDLTTSDSGV